MRHLISKPSPAMLVACLALFVGMTGASYAAATIGSAQIKKNAVLSKHIKNGQVKTADLHAGAVKSAKVADGSLTGADVADGSLTGADLAIHSIASGNLAPDSVDSAKVRDNTLTGDDVDESTLGTVPDATTLQGKAPTAFVSSTIYKAESTLGPGTALGDGTYYIDKACNPGDVLLSGGPANVSATSWMVESFATPGSTNSWRARINKNAQTDNFSVVILCAQQS
jgi:hypothetical protein